MVIGLKTDNWNATREPNHLHAMDQFRGALHEWQSSRNRVAFEIKYKELGPNAMSVTSPKPGQIVPTRDPVGLNIWIPPKAVTNTLPWVSILRLLGRPSEQNVALTKWFKQLSFNPSSVANTVIFSKAKSTEMFWFFSWIGSFPEFSKRAWIS